MKILKKGCIYLAPLSREQISLIIAAGLPFRHVYNLRSPLKPVDVEVDLSANLAGKPINGPFTESHWSRGRLAPSDVYLRLPFSSAITAKKTHLWEHNRALP